MNFNTPFQVQAPKPNVSIDSDTKVVFVADLFAEQYAGGAELTTDALYQKCPYKCQRILSKDVDLNLLEQGFKAFWVFGNFAAMDLSLIPSIVANMQYAVLEYDYKYCKYRSPEKHKFAEQKDCDCENDSHGKLISAFYFGAKNIFWMSEDQMRHYYKMFPFLQDGAAYGRGPLSTVLSSVFDDNFFVFIKQLRKEAEGQERKGWVVLGSTSWVKGAEQAEKWCKDAGVEYEIVWNLPYADLLKKLSLAEGFVYLPQGMDTCPRMVIEAKLLGCRLHINDFVQQRHEEWFDTDNLEHIEEYLYGARDLFWRSVSSHVDYIPTISGYVTTKDCIDQSYPFEECIKSMMSFCDEVVVVDGGSTDGTIGKVLDLAVSTLSDEEKVQHANLIEDVRNFYASGADWSFWAGKYEEDGSPRTPIKVNFPKFRLHVIPRDWNEKRFAVYDGLQKAEARKLCTKEYCWQMDADEIVPPGDGEKVINLCKNWPQLAELISLPVVEYWGSKDKVRVDVNPWKWRVSRNLPHITHGIPKELRKFDENGDLYASPGTDGCDYVHSETFDRIPHMSFYGEGAHNARFAALNGNQEALRSYEMWLKNSTDLLPTVQHHSWLDIARKIKTYRGYWQKHWESLYDVKQEDTAENNMFFDLPWSQVTDQMIDDLAKRLAEETGGHIFHTKINWAQPTPSVRV